jgi:hypothetical protein
LIRLFGRGKSGKSGGGARSEVGAVDAGDISAALADLTTASLSATWRCRHASGTSLAEGSVNFTERSSQAVVIRGKHTYEYVRRSSSVLRSEVLDEALVVQNAAEEPEAEQGADPEDPDAELDETGLEAAESDEDDGEDGDEADPDAEAEESEPEASAEDDESEDDGEEEAEDGDDEPAAEADADAEPDEDEEGDEEGEGDDEDALTAEAEAGESGEPGESAEEESKPAAPARPAWNYFSDSDACGPHAYAEPDVLAKAALSSGAVQIAKPEEFNGVLHNAYTVTLKPKPTDSDKALARLARQLRDHGANVIVVTAFTNPDAALDEDDDEDEDEVDELDLDEGEERGADDDVEEYEDFDDVVAAGGLGRHDDEDDEGRRRGPADPAKRIVRLRIELPHWTPADDPGADHAVRIDLFDLGEPVQIESPGRSNATRRTLRTCADLSLF